MFSGIWNFVKRHRRKFVFAGAVIGGAIVVSKYAKKKFQELQDDEAAECLSYARRQHHFDSNQRTCNMTVLSMMPTVRDALLQAMDSESLTAQLKNRPDNKIEIWETLKIMSFTRTICSVYSSCMLIVVLRVQLNIIGGYMYLDSVLNKNGTAVEPAVATSEVQNKYLQNIYYLVQQGLTDLIGDVDKAVQNVIGSMSLKERVSLYDVQEIFTKVRKQLEYRQHNGYYDAPTTSLCRFIIPEESGLDQACSLSQEEITLNKLMKETQDMLESADFHSVITMCLDTAFARLLDKSAEYFKSTPVDGAAMINPNDVKLPLAKIVPIMNGLVHFTCGDAPNPFVQELLLKEQVKNFAANVYEAFSQVEDQTPA
jgi:peroxin-3